MPVDDTSINVGKPGIQQQNEKIETANNDKTIGKNVLTILFIMIDLNC